ncbi:MAG TPA: glycosyltransferase family 4 protein [bacterium]|nr:glycosyltransferase family 4 protein [bacterium]
MNPAPTVLQVVPALEPGGVSRGTIEVAAALVDAGWTALVASSGGPGVKELEAVGGRHVTLPLQVKNPFLMWRNAGPLADLIRRERVDLVHALSRAPAWSAYWAARRTRRPLVTSFHAIYKEDAFYKRQYNSVMVRGDRVIAVSGYIGHYIHDHYGLDGDRLRVIERGADLRIYDPSQVAPERVEALRQRWQLPEGMPVISLPGRLTARKGQRVLIEALASLPHRHFHCLLIGDEQGRNEYRSSLEEQVAYHGLQDHVTFTGHCADMAAAYLLSNLVISTTTVPEAFGRVVTEAQAMGCLVIASDHGGPKDTILPGETGWLTPPGNPAALAAAIVEALALPPTRRTAMVELARDRVRTLYSSERMCRDTLQVYRELLSQPAPAGRRLPPAPDPAPRPPLART